MSLVPLILSLLAHQSLAQTWCGKVYMQNQTIIPPGGQFQVPAGSTTPLLSLRCQPALVPFLPEDETTAQIIVDAIHVFAQWPGAQPYTAPDPSTHTGTGVSVVASVDGVQLAVANVPLNETTLLNAPLQGLAPRVEPYNLTCVGTVGNQTYTFFSNLTYLPSPPTSIGSVTKRDLISGGLLAKKASAQDYEPVFPVGFYTTYEGYLEGNDSAVEVIAQDGLNIIHPVPSFDNRTAFNQMVSKMEELGLWLMYDMRETYMNLTAVQAETTPLQSRSNLLLYYTADEPDGTSDPPNATLAAYNLLRSLDPYRPTSLVLNCADYHWTDYAAAADIILQDVYNIGNDLQFSSTWGTPCTQDEGVCGCDDCNGGMQDIIDRVDSFEQRMKIMGWDRTKTVWTVPQGFGGTEYWNRTPTGAEWLAEAIVGINAGATGVVSWNDPTTDDIKSAASTLARAAPALAPYLLSSAITTKHATFSEDTFNVGLHALANGSTLVLATSLVDNAVSISLTDLLTEATLFGPDQAVQVQSVQNVMDGGASIDGGGVRFNGMQSGAWIVQAAVTTSTTSDAVATEMGSRAVLALVLAIANVFVVV